MMEVLIVEDEMLSAERLKQLILAINESIKIVDVIDSVEDTVKWLRNNTQPDLIFLDIHLADGSGFEIFNQTEVKSPIIFTTAYDEYAIKAFKVDSIDYLLKPIEKGELNRAFDKFYKLKERSSNLTSQKISELFSSFNKTYKDRFMVKSGKNIVSLKTNEIAYFYSEDKITFIRTKQGKKHIIDYSLGQLEELMSPEQFFRVNRKIIINIEAIDKIESYLNNRLMLTTSPAHTEGIIVSREKVSDFKKWLDS